MAALVPVPREFCLVPPAVSLVDTGPNIRPLKSVKRCSVSSMFHKRRRAFHRPF
jgi:hypothetical protein